MHLLAGDIGGTKTLLQLSAWNHGAFEILAQERLPSARYDSLQALVQDFRARHPQAIDSACFAVAGPVQDQCSQLTYLPWFLDARVLGEALEIPRVQLINDFAAIGYALDHLRPEDLVCLHRGHGDITGNRALLGAGTGLGQAIIHRSTSGLHVLPTEGGHADFAPANPEQQQLLSHLWNTRERVSFDDLLSGKGIVTLYEYLRDSAYAPENPQLAARWPGDDSAALITGFALEQQDPLAHHCLEMFSAIYGAQAGNLALASLATGGVYLAGGIAPRILPYLQSDLFLQAFLHKNPMQELMQRIPVWLITNTECGLLGSRIVASSQE